MRTRKKESRYLKILVTGMILSLIICVSSILMIFNVDIDTFLKGLVVFVMFIAGALGIILTFIGIGVEYEEREKKDDKQL